MTETTRYEKIVNYVNVIVKKPNKSVKYFALDKDNQFIVDGKKLSLLASVDYNKHKAKNEFWVHVDPKHKDVMYYSYDIEDDISGQQVHEEQGYFQWDLVENSIYNFLVLNIQDLSCSSLPYTEVGVDDSSFSRSMPAALLPTPKPIETKKTSTYDYNSSHHYYGSPAYKAREAFYDKITALMKSNRTSAAMDYISETIKDMCKENRFEELDIWLRLLSIDKLNITTMLGILRTTLNSDHLLKERKDFYNKVKTHIAKIKPTRVDLLLKGLEPKIGKDAIK